MWKHSNDIIPVNHYINDIACFSIYRPTIADRWTISLLQVNRLLQIDELLQIDGLLQIDRLLLIDRLLQLDGLLQINRLLQID